MSDLLKNTIAAVSTPRGKGGVALIRISGSDALAVGRKIFRTKKDPAECPRCSLFGEIVFPEGCGRAGESIDTGLLTYFRAPASFTGEDTVEICCHGGVLVTRTVLTAALLAGARQAEKGEFTRRAFVSGKISLPEAEALGMLLDAGTDAQLRLSHAGMSGTLTAAITALRLEITALLTDIYARIDFPEEDLGSIPEAEIRDRIAALTKKTSELMATYSTGKAIAEGIETVICGRTNAGKSTLYNRMSGSEDAIVTDIEGTTRDILSSTVSFGGATLHLHDTAGIRAGSGDRIEQIGIDRAKDKIASAELLLFLIDGTRPPAEDDIALADMLASHPGHVIAVMTKSDVAVTDAGAQSLFDRFELKARISALTGEGIEALESLVGSLFIDGKLDLSRDTVISSARQYSALERTNEALRASCGALENGYAADILSVCLEDAANALSELDGRGFGAVNADVIDGIFSKFCVGK